MLTRMPANRAILLCRMPTRMPANRAILLCHMPCCLRVSARAHDPRFEPACCAVLCYLQVSARARDPRFQRFERWRSEVIPGEHTRMHARGTGTHAGGTGTHAGGMGIHGIVMTVLYCCPSTTSIWHV